VTVCYGSSCAGPSTALVESLLFDVELRRAGSEREGRPPFPRQGTSLPVKEEDLGLGGAVTRPSVWVPRCDLVIFRTVS